MYLVKANIDGVDTFYGPFYNHEAAHRWATPNLAYYNWSIHPLNRA